MSIPTHRLVFISSMSALIELAKKQRRLREADAAALGGLNRGRRR